MAVCERPSTSIYTDSGNPTHMSTETSTDTSSEGSTSGMILSATSGTKKKKGGPPGTRRSSRLSKIRGGVTNDDESSSDDDSDPHIDVGDVLLGDEEKLLVDEEIRADEKRKTQMMAVALVKSVVQNQVKAEIKQSAESFGQQTQKLNIASTESVPKGRVNVIEVKVEDAKEESPIVDVLPNENNTASTKTEVQNAPAMTTTKVKIAEEAKVSNASVANACANAPVMKAESDQQKTLPIRANVTTRSKSKNTKSKTVGLKAQYASIRETRRYAPKPTLPVPNPILSSPALAPKATGARTITVQSATQAISKKKHPATKSKAVVNVSIKKEPLAMPPSAPLPVNTLAAPTVSVREGGSTSHVQNTQTKSNESNPSGNMIPPARRRIFSIDLDPEGFDFDLSIGVVDYVENSAELPPISSTTYSSRKPSDASAPNEMPLYRGRGMSFELFNFGGSNLDTASDLRIEALSGGRPRGDSIIFDPISFSDGGIHEETALKKTRGSFKLDESEELNLLNTTGFVEPPLAPPQAPSQAGGSQQGQVSRTQQQKRGVSSSSNIPNPVSLHPAAQITYTSRSKASSGRQSKSRLSYHGKSSSKSKHNLSMVGGNSSAKDDTLHMPQGSAAAAAAAASLSSQILQSTMNGTISHTSCPMELLNKGGRIGIYLPEARRHRIAKFHSKRKNRIWRKRIKYDCRKKLADSRPRVKGRFVKSLEPEEE